MNYSQGSPTTPTTPRRATSGRKKISKDEKICKLKSDLKISREENVRLKREIERLRQNQGGGGGNSSSNTNASSTGNDQQPSAQEKKFREAMRAMKKVTVSQEMCIKTLRAKAKERQKEIKQRDAYIASLEQRAKSLEASANAIEESHGDPMELAAKFEMLQLEYDTVVQRNNDLEEILDEKEAQMGTLQKQRNSLLTPLHKNHGKKQRNGKHGESSDNESAGSGSMQSVSTAGQSISTAGDFDVARLKKELAEKSQKILKLQMDLEMANDELYDVKHKRASTSSSHDLFAVGGVGANASPFFAPDPFNVSGSMGQSQHGGDDWTEADETDNESEFGEAQFGEDHFGDHQFGDFFDTTTSKGKGKEADFW